MVGNGEITAGSANSTPCFTLATYTSTDAVCGGPAAYRKYSLDYVGGEELAKRAKLGIRSGSLEMPWDWRVKESKH